MPSSGTLSVKLKSNSSVIGYSTPIYVRDRNLKLVKELRSADSLQLPSGLYEVSTVLENGNNSAELVEILEGQDTKVELGSAYNHDKYPLHHVAACVKVGIKKHGRLRKKISRRKSLSWGSSMATHTGTAVQLVECKGAQLISSTNTLWKFQSESHLTAVPTVLIKLEDCYKKISLPISPEKNSVENTCHMRLDELGRSGNEYIWISPDRKIAHALQSMLRTGHLIQAANVATDAMDLLKDKYRDPTGAALGALLLQKVGRLKEKTHWVENLANDFPWLPDGKIMLAVLLKDDDATKNRALELALEASDQKILYSESYSILLDLLRRWPSAIDEDERITSAVKKLAKNSPIIDWQSTCLTVQVER